MNKVINSIASIMIIILICALVWIFITYNRTDDVINNIYGSGEKNVSTLHISSGEYIPDENFMNESSLIESIIKDSGNSHEFSDDNKSNLTANENESNQSSHKDNNNIDIESGDDIGSNPVQSGEELPNTIIEIPSNNESTGNLVISSDPQTSNQEKQEILTEIDTALKGLLEAVGKVEVVDEDKLNASLDSEVEKP